MNKQEIKRILVIAPHPDDEILGCGGTIIKAIKRGYYVCILYLSSGDKNQSLREKEAIKVCRYLKIKRYYFLRLKKNKFIVSTENIKKILKVFKKTSPEIIFINHDQDGDLEHSIAYQLITNSYWRYNIEKNNDKKLPSLLLYEIHKPMQTYNLVENITDQIQEKMTALSLYKSQLKNSRIDLAVKGLNQYRGSMHEGVDFAEVFQIKRSGPIF